MWDPEDYKKGKVPSQLPNPPPRSLEVLDEDKMFEYFLLHQESTRAFYGLSMVEKKLVVVDKERLDKVPEDKKMKIREIWKRVNR
jgi:hypothetical protein